MPSTSTDLIDGLSTSTAVKAPCRVHSTVNLTLEGAQTVNSVAVVAGDRVLVTAQTDATENGIWDVQTGAWTRSKDADGNRDWRKGTRVYTQGATVYRLTTSDPVVVGTSELDFEAVTEGTALDAGDGLIIIGNTISIQHPEEHIDHSDVTLTAGVALSGGGTIEESRTFDVSITELTAETEFDVDADYLMVHDASVPAVRKGLIGDIIGTRLGDGKWYLSGTPATGAEATIVFDTEVYDLLERGSFSIGTGVYTAGANGARLLVIAHATVNDVNIGADITLSIEAPGTTPVSVSTHRNDSDGTAFDQSIECSVTVVLSAGETVTTRIATSAAEALVGGASTTYLSIVELG